MSGAKCSCDKFGRLEGASAGAYASAFLDDEKGEAQTGAQVFRCRVCGTRWEKRAPDVESAGKRPALVRLDRVGGE